MKSKMVHSLVVCLILTVGYLSPAQAVSDAELEALEKEIEQLEAKEKNAEAEAKRKVEQKRKAEAEAKRKADEEAEKQAEEKRKQEAEEKRLAEEETKRQGEEAKKRDEEEKKEKYTLLITEAEQAVSNKNKELAISKYNKALTLYPNNPVAISGLKEADKLMDNICYDFVGKWAWQGQKTTMEIFENRTMKRWGFGSWTKPWECILEKRQLKLIHGGGEYDFLTLSQDGTCLADTGLWPSDGCWRKQGY